MLVLHATKKLRDRLRGAAAHQGEPSTTALGDWYATVLFWRPQLALFVNEPTLLSVLASSLASHSQDVDCRGRIAKLDNFIQVLDGQLEPPNYRVVFSQKSAQAEVLSRDGHLGPDF